jgi:oxygen-independent coproporphyrinogen-3 oxidase
LIDKDSIQHLIRKYDRPGPRYTSYPPAPVFSSDFGPGDYLTAIKVTESNKNNTDLSLYFHFPFCDTLCYFCGCTTVVTHSRDRIEQYITYLKKEISLLAPMIGSHRNVVQLHWGGGTPTSLSPSQIEDVGNYIRQSFRFDPQAEISVEIDPRDVTLHHLKALRQVGFNRVSIGVQDFSPKVQFAVNRNQSEFITRQVIDWCRSLGFSSINIDLIYGLPLQTTASFSETLDKIIDISPERIAVYNFAYVPWMKKHQSVIHVEDLPSPETKLDIITATIEKLSTAGYVYLGMDHFAKPEDELTVSQRMKTLRRNFQGYSTKAGSDLYGLGMSSISHFGNYYAQNAKTLAEYYLALDNGTLATRMGYAMTEDDEIRKQVIMRLMCQLSLNYDEIEQEFGIDFHSYFAESLAELQPLAEDGLVKIEKEQISIPLPGRLFLRNIAMCFDAYQREPQAKPSFSRTV